jgi:hypothetical protein
MRIIFVPQFPSEMRYQEWWVWKLPEEFEKRGLEVLTLGKDEINKIQHTRSTLPMFSPIRQAIELEATQIKEYMNLDLRDDDILFWADISFPGIFGNVLFHQRPKKMYAFCHATALNNLDYYSNVRDMKFPIESSVCRMFDKIFVGSCYHKNKLRVGGHSVFRNDAHWRNLMVTYLPFPPLEFDFPKIEKTIDIMSASRPNPQKVDEQLEKLVEASFGEIKRPISNSWYNYFYNLRSSKILLITAYEDTFGYQIVDAVMNNCIPLARRDLAYPELLPDEYLYSTPGELMSKIDFILNANVHWTPEVKVPKLLCEEQMNNFYDAICDEMKGKNKDHPF